MYEELTIKKGIPSTQDFNIQFFSIDEISIQNPFSNSQKQRIQNWSLSIDIGLSSKEVLKEEVEEKLNNIDSGIEKLKKYSNAEEYLKHIDDVINE